MTGAVLTRVLLSTCVAGALLPRNARAWGDEGHEVIAIVAQGYLTPRAARTAQALLSADHDALTASDFVSRATWADKFRDSDRDTTKVRYNATHDWHFVDLEIDSPDPDAACNGHPPIPPGTPASAGPAGDCVVDKIDQFTNELHSASTPVGERLLALKYLLHLVGDVHQPLHAADHHDAGGNKVQVLVGHDTILRLHAYWDTQLVEKLGRNPRAVAAALRRQISKSQADQWATGTPADWAEDSFAQAKAVAYDFTGEAIVDDHGSSVPRLDAIYERRALPVVREQLSKAGVRLAAVLNGTATADVASPSGGVESGGVQPAKTLFVVAMENHDASRIYGSPDAPFINGTLMPTGATADNFEDELPLNIPSEPHYVWMEAGTNTFNDHTFTTDDPSSRKNSTSDPDHLVTQIRNVGGGLDWTSYQEGLDAQTGRCPIVSAGFYHPKHDPFVFFQTVAGNPPAKDNPYCAAHHKPLSALATDLQTGHVATYNFVTPNQCHDMHGQVGCPNKNVVQAGDEWLAQNLPAMIDYVTAHGGVVFVVFDEGEHSATMPFFAAGPGVKKGYRGSVRYTHSSLLKSVELMLGLPVLARVADANDFSDLFELHAFP